MFNTCDGEEGGGGYQVSGGPSGSKGWPWRVLLAPHFLAGVSELERWKRRMFLMDRREGICACADGASASARGASSDASRGASPLSREREDGTKRERRLFGAASLPLPLLLNESCRAELGGGGI